jgi:type I site-specific restriction endonuclease
VPERPNQDAHLDRFRPMDGGQLTAEQRARVLIDRQLTDAGWSVQSRNELNPPRRDRLRRSPARC